jgi:hypothetical protein
VSLLCCATVGQAQEAGTPLPALTDEQRTQLATADDHRPPDEPALYPLLVNVASWDAAAVREMAASGEIPGLAPGSLPPDYEKLLDEPDAFRGELFLVEGRYAGRQRRQRLLRGGPWGPAVTEWGVVVDAQRGGGAERVAVVYLVDPTPSGDAPREGAFVRVVGRFYKVWEDRDAAGGVTRYPVFVGVSPAVPQWRADEGAWTTVIVAAVFVLAGGMVVLRWWTRRRGRPRRRVRAGAADSFEGDDEELPGDPAEALEQLEARRDIQGDSA